MDSSSAFHSCTNTHTEAKGAPELSFGTATGTYIVVGIDLDAPFPFIGVHVLHWLVQSYSLHIHLTKILPRIQSGLTLEPAGDGSHKLSAGSTPVIANYLDPAPPLPPPHRYVFLLYEQPEAFDASKFVPPGGKPLGVMKRFGYDLGKFEKEAQLGLVVACNYFNSK